MKATKPCLYNPQSVLYSSFVFHKNRSLVPRDGTRGYYWLNRLIRSSGNPVIFPLPEYSRRIYPVHPLNIIMTEAIALIIFALAFVLIIFEPFEKSIIAMLGALLMMLVGVIDPHHALQAIEWETIFLLLGMMLLVNMASTSGILDWLNVRIATYTKGNPLAIFTFFSLITAVLSAFLDNVTTVILIVPITIALLQGMGKDPKLYIIAEILFSNVGGALTLIGDPPNIIIGGATGFSFMDFVRNLWLPILGCMIFLYGFFFLRFRNEFKPINTSLVESHLAGILIEKIKHQFLKRTLNKWFIIKVSAVLFLTILGFLSHEMTHIPAFVIALLGGITLSIISSKQIDIHDAYSKVEWTTLFFFMGLFMMVAGVEETGILEDLSQWMVTATSNKLELALLILWVAGLVSMVLDNIPFVAVMIPVILGIQDSLGIEETEILWWALSLGACLGGNGTLVGASANVISANLAHKAGVPITFLEYTKFCFPLTIVMLLISSVYLYWAISFT